MSGGYRETAWTPHTNPELAQIGFNPAGALAAITALNRAKYNLSSFFMPTSTGTSNSVECAKCQNHFFNQTAEEVEKMICPIDRHPHYIDDQSLWSLPRLNAGRIMVALDCEMILTSRGSELAQLVIVGEDGEQLALWNIKPKGVVVDLLTKFSGIRSIEELIQNSIDFEDLPYLLADLGVTADTYIIGHGLESDFKAMRLYHQNVIDSAILFHRAELGAQRQKLKTLVNLYLGRQIQEDCHDPSEDAVAALELVKLYQHSMFDMNALCQQVCITKSDLNLPVRYLAIHRHEALRPPQNFVPNEARTCHGCGQIGHMKSNCPHKKEVRVKAKESRNRPEQHQSGSRVLRRESRITPIKVEKSRKSIKT